MGKYQLFVGPSTSAVPVQEVTLFDSWQLDRNIDDGCTLSFVMPGNSPAGVLVDELSWDIWLYLDGQTDQRFRIVELERSWDGDGRHDVSVDAVCYRRIFASRHLNTNLSFSNVSQGLILWDLIQHTQGLTGGDLGVTLGNSGPNILRTREYEAGSNILELAVNLSQVQNGLTWDVDENLALQVSTFTSYPFRAQPVVLGANAKRIVKPSGAALFANAVLVTGDSQSTSLVIEETADLGTDPRGRWERFQAFSSVVQQTQLQEQADGLLEETNSPAIMWEFEVEPKRFFGDSDYELGDFLSLVEPGGSTVQVQVLTQSISQSADGDVSVTYNAVQVSEPVLSILPVLPV